MQPDINKMTEIELKALNYDQIVMLEQTQSNIGLINEQIKKRQGEPKADVVEQTEEAPETQPEG